MSTRNNLVFCFSATEKVVGSVIHSFQEEDADEKADSIMASSILTYIRTVRNQRFSDLQHYQRLCAEPDCVKVRISCVRCYYNHYFMGLQVVYRSTFTNGTSRKTEAPEHFFSSGDYAYKGGHPNFLPLELEDEDGEFITGLRLNQGEIVDGVTFVTNRREVHFGGQRGTRYEDTMNSLTTYRIVAFTGTEDRVMQRIGYFAENISWETIGPLVMLRWLVERKRAAPSLSDAECTHDHLVVRALVGAEASVSLSDEIFRRVLWFLID